MEGKEAQGLKYNGKMFVMFYKRDIAIKLKPENVKKTNGKLSRYSP